MRAFMEPDQIGRAPAGVGHANAPEYVPTVESIMADLARLSVEDRMAVRLKLNMQAYGANVRMRDSFEIVIPPPPPKMVTADDFGKHMTGYIVPRDPVTPFTGS